MTVIAPGKSYLDSAFRFPNLKNGDKPLSYLIKLFVVRFQSNNRWEKYFVFNQEIQNYKAV